MGQPFNPGPYLQQKSKQQVREWQVEVNKECKGRSRIRQGHAFQGLRSLCIHMGVKEAFLHTVEIWNIIGSILGVVANNLLQFHKVFLNINRVGETFKLISPV